MVKTAALSWSNFSSNPATGHIAVEIPYTELSEEALQGVIEEFILREGTDYGATEYSLEQKIEQVREQLKAGSIRLTFDADSETCNLERVERI